MGPGSRVVRLKVIEPADVRLFGARRYQGLRRASLAISFLVTLAVPLWHLRSIESQSAGVSGGARWADVARAAHLPTAQPPLVGGPAAISLFGLELCDPLSIAGVTVAAGPSLALLWSFWPAALLVALLGRFFCGWICPYVPILSANNALRSFLARRGFRMPDVQLPRRSSLLSLGVLLAATAVTGSQIAPLFYPPAIVSREVFRAVFWGGIGVGGALLLAAFLFDLLFARAGFCRYLCPGGALFGVLGALSPVRIRREVAKCTDCTLCDAVCNFQQSPMTDRIDSACERCGKCVSSCPTDALSIGFGRANGGRK